jgi:hypothetical protein
MKETIIKEIVEKVFQKAKTECPKHSKYALSKHIAESTAISSKTLERLHDKYLKNKDVVGEQLEHTINALCQYLNFESYSEYVKHNGRNKESTDEEGKKRNKNWKIITVVCLVLGVGLILGLSDKNVEPKCMVWKTDHFEKADCAVSYKEKVVPLDEARLMNFKKIPVTIRTSFFSEETDNPLIWYYQNGKEIEYFTAPGLHPINGKTLKAITPYMIDKHVPIHSFNQSSFTD